MKKLANRWIAGISAAALLVSAIGFDSITNVFLRTASAEDDNKKTARSTGFSNLEQDTEDDVYNTGYGLHTNKTAEEVADGTGRTFDVNLESWYVGENPVDVATILDASGSMAWTVDTLSPLVIDYKCFDSYEDTYSVKIENLTDLQSIQTGNDGYLPQEIVDCILDPANTDNSKLSYAGYKYYIYEDRSTVDEFVPLGYWDGTLTRDNPTDNAALIGYYQFDGSLVNEVSTTGGEGKYIANVAEKETFDKEKVITVTPQPVFSDGYLDLSETDKNGNLVIDLSTIDIKKDIDITFTLNCADVTKNCAPQAPILYLGDGTNNKYLALMRGRSHDTGSGASKHIYVYQGDSKGGSPLDAHDKDDKLIPKDDEKPEEEYTNDNNVLDKSLGKDINCEWKIRYNNDTLYDITLVVGSNEFIYHSDENYFGSESLYLVIGGDEILPKGNLQNTNKTEDVIDPTDLKGIKIKNLTITGTDTIGDEYSQKFALTSNAQSEGGDLEAEYKKQSAIGTTTTLSKESQDPVPASAVYAEDKALNLTQTAKKGAILLDAMPDNDDNFTLSFKVKKAAKDDTLEAEANILYIGSTDTSKTYYRIYRGFGSSARRLKMSKGNGENGYASINNIFSDDKDYSMITIVVNGTTVTQYVDGKLYTESNSPKNLDDTISHYIMDTPTLSLILGGLWNGMYDDADILIDDLYVFNDALTRNEVNDYFSNENCNVKDRSHARTKVLVDEKANKRELVDIAQISTELAGNSDENDRRGWYYVNSHSKWEDITGCLESGKQFYGIYDKGKEADKTGLYRDEAGIDKATIPSGASSDLQASITAGDTNVKKFDESPEHERSIRFYVDSQNHLRCFAWSGSTSKEGDIRTFCSLVYEKGTNADGSEQITKYEELNNALNRFYSGLANGSDLSNSAVVRFSTNNAAKDLDKLVMKDWTNWSEFYQELPESEKAGADKSTYMADLLIPADGETSLDTTISTAQKIKEYPYVMTGGTYTWTGLKAFYDYMVNTKDKEKTRVYDIANDARDKYLIIFTDGRDNTQDLDTADKGKVYNANDMSNGNSPKDHPASCNGELAEAWADQIKDEGYTIFCVMMATGSISETNNKDEFDRAFNFLTTLAGDTETDKELDDLNKQLEDAQAKVDAGEEIDDKLIPTLKEKISDISSANVIVADPTKEGSTTVEAFQNILKQIQQPRKDYTVQDYIDPRFDLVDKDGNLYQLGAGGKITVKNDDGTTIKEVTVGNIIDNIDKTGIETLAYTPRKSYMVNRKPAAGTEDGYDNGDGTGTGYLYYDDVKDMYYLRWTDQVIPMENEAFNTTAPDGKKLDVWSATIRLKAKDDFIGGNNILTNGNEAGENLVYSDATIENMDKDENYKLYGFKDTDLVEVDGKNIIPYRKKLEVLSGTDRKINAVDAGGVSQAVYGDGIDIPSSGFPRTTVNVRLLPLNAQNLNDVIYMGEVVSPTMMLADLEDGYMTGSYYLQYLERYAYRVYGTDVDSKPLLDLLNEWLKINNEKETEKTFTIPYMYLPDPVYEGDKLHIDEDIKRVEVSNSSGASWKDNILDFTDPNLRDVTGFITYTWKRDDSSQEEQQKTGETNATGDPLYDITKEYVVKNTDQIKYNLQLKFTPLKETKEELKDFKLDQNFIKGEGGEPGDKFFNIGTDGEFAEMTTDPAWSTKTAGRADYLKAMIQEKHTYEPHVMYDGTATGGKWKLIGTGEENEALTQYTDDDQTKEAGGGKVTDSGVYDWDSEYKPVAGSKQLENGKDNSIKKFYTDTPNNVNLLDVSGDPITDETGKVTGTDPISLAANTTYVKDVVNGALALELFVDGKYLQSGTTLFSKEKEFTFEATRYYEDPNDPLPYDKDNPIGASTKEDGVEYQLTFKVDKIPDDPQESTIYPVWATLTKVEVKKGTGGYVPIDTKSGEALYDESIKSYLGYTVANALPIGTYVISVTDTEMKNPDTQYHIGTDGSSNVQFQYLKIDNSASNYKYNKFPDSVYKVSGTAVKSTGDDKYLIKNGVKDYSPENIAVSDRDVKTIPDTQTVKFYFGTVEEKEVGTEMLKNTKGESVKDYLKEHPDTTSTAEFTNDYAKDRLGIIMLSADPNSLTISKEVTNYKDATDLGRSWEFTVTVNLDKSEAIEEFEKQNKTEVGFKLKWYKGGVPTDATAMGTYNGSGSYPETITFKGSDGAYTATIYLKHDEKVVINGLPDGTWQVIEAIPTDNPLYTPHNNANGLGEEEWIYQKSDKTSTNTLTPASQVGFVNEFPYSLPSAGGEGINRYIFFGTAGTIASALLAAMLWYNRRKRRAMHE